MMKKLLICMLCILMICSFVLSFSNSNSKMQNEVVSYQYKDDNKLSKSNDELFKKVEKLEKLAQDYINERQIDANATELCLQYLRRDRYNNDKWRGLLGPVDADFVSYVEKNDPELEFDNFEVLYDLGTNRGIDFIHMAAVLNSYVRYGDTISLVVTDLSSDYAGWAGDLLTFLEEIVNYRIENQPEEEELEYEDEEEYEERMELVQQYAISLLGTNAESTMSGPDVYADFDAYLIYSDSSIDIKNGLYEGLIKYYKSHESTNHANNRFANLKKRFGDTEIAISNTVRPYMQNLLIRKLFIPDTTEKVTNDDIEIVLKAFSNYILGVLYMDIEPVEEAAVVGKEKKVKIIENHLDFANVTVDPPELATAKISGEYIVVKPLEAGDATLTVTSLVGNVTKSYVLEIVNVAPKVIKGLETNYYFNVNESESISIKAEGTNNVYTWYMSNSLTGDYTVMAETSSPTYVLNPTDDMDNKYVKCGVKNKGNDEVFTNTTIFIVSGSAVEEVIRKNDTLIIIVVIVLLLILVLVIVYFTVIRGTTYDPFNKNKNVVYVTDVNNGYYGNDVNGQGMYPNQYPNQNNGYMNYNDPYNQNNMNNQNNGNNQNNFF